MKRSITILSAAALCCFLLTAATPPAQAKPDKTQGVALMSAHVFRQAILEHGAGVVSVERVSTTPGRYRVTFKREVQGCGRKRRQRHGILTVFEANEFEPTVIQIETFDLDGNFTDKSFSLTVFCAQ